jgi:hypothetical protein
MGEDVLPDRGPGRYLKIRGQGCGYRAGRPRGRGPSSIKSISLLAPFLSLKGERGMREKIVFSIKEGFHVNGSGEKEGDHRTI